MSFIRLKLELDPADKRQECVGWKKDRLCNPVTGYSCGLPGPGRLAPSGGGARMPGWICPY